MPVDLTASLYAMIVLSYGTLVTTSYIFAALESRGRRALEEINKLQRGECSFIWRQQATAVFQIQTDGKKTPEQSIKDEFDFINTGANMRASRWAAVEYALYISVLIPSVLLFPVLLLKVGAWNGAGVLGRTIVVAMVFGQAFASVSVPTVGINLVIILNKLKRMDVLLDRMRTVSIGLGATQAATVQIGSHLVHPGPGISRR